MGDPALPPTPPLPPSPLSLPPLSMLPASVYCGLESSEFQETPANRSRPAKPT